MGVLRKVKRQTRVISYNPTPRGVRFAKVYNLDDYRFGRRVGTAYVDALSSASAVGRVGVSRAGLLAFASAVGRGEARGQQQRGFLFQDTFGSLFSPFPSSTVSSVEVSEGFPDRRHFSPSVSAPARKPLVMSPSLHLAPSGELLAPRGRFYNHLGFSVPQQVLVCVRRKQRRQVLFAKGKSGSGNRKPRWNANSYIWC